MRRRTSLAAALAAIALAVGIAAWRFRPAGETFELPPALPVDTDVVTMADALGSVQGLPDGVRVAPVAPRHGLLATSGPRDAVIVPPGTHVPLRVRVPPDALLTFGIGVEGDGRKDVGAAGVRFTVAVDGRERFARVVNPAARYADRVWFDETIDLGPWAGRDVDIDFATALVGTGRPAGTPGWSHARVVRRRWRARQPADVRTPNVLVLLVDTLRVDPLGCYGGRPSRSPRLDALAHDGTVFEQHVAAAPWTLPATATLLTGLHPQTNGTLEGQTLPDGVRTIAEAAADAGITTVGVSANPLVSRGTNFAQGFETFVEHEVVMHREDGVVTKTPASAATVNATFLRWLDRNRAHRFFAYLHYMEPHEPYTPPAHLRPPAPPGIRPMLAAGRLAPFLPAIRSAAGFQPSPEELAYLRRLYDAEVRGWDEQLAVLLDALAARDVLASTIVVVTADHGEEFLDHGRLTHGSHLYDELLHVPLVIAGPGIARRRVTRQTSGVDVFPTLAGLLGVPVPPGLPGHDALAAAEDSTAFSITRGGRLLDGRAAELLSVRTPAAKLVWAPALAHYEFYDLTSDPGEHVDRWGASPEAARLAATLAAWQATTPTATPGRPDAAGDERLRALGYVE